MARPPTRAHAGVMATAAEAGRCTGHFSQAPPSHGVTMPGSMGQLSGPPQQQAREPGSSTEVSNPSSSLQGGVVDSGATEGQTHDSHEQQPASLPHPSLDATLAVPLVKAPAGLLLGGPTHQAAAAAANGAAQSDGAAPSDESEAEDDEEEAFSPSRLGGAGCLLVPCQPVPGPSVSDRLLACPHGPPQGSSSFARVACL